MYSLSNSQKEQNFLGLHQVWKKRFSLVRKTNNKINHSKKTPSTHILWSQPPLRCHWHLGTRHKLLIRPRNVPGLCSEDVHVRVSTQPRFLPRSSVGLSTPRFKRLFNSMTFSLIISSLPRFVFFHFGEQRAWISGSILCPSLAISFVLWLHILANSRCLTNVCWMNELRIKALS